MASIVRRLTDGESRPLAPAPPPPPNPPATTIVDRFPNTLTTTKATTTAKKVATSAATTAKKVAKAKPKPILIRAQQTRGPRYGIVVEFSDDNGQSFGPELRALPSKTYRVMMTFTQHQAEPLLQGAAFDWILPTGWKFMDGHGRRQYEMMISNPLQIIRLIKSPTAVAKTFVKVLCPKVYG